MGESNNNVHPWGPELLVAWVCIVLLKKVQVFQTNIVTFDNNPQLRHVYEKLEALTEDEDTNNTDEYSGNHKVSSLSPA